MERPNGETRRERRLQRIVGTGVVVLFLLLGVIVLQGVVQYRSQVNHHAASVKQQNTIIAQNKVIERQNGVIITDDGVIKADTAALVAFHAQTVSILNQIHTLQVEFTQSVGQIPAVAQALMAGQNALIAKLDATNAKITALCAVLPSTVCSTH